MKARGLLPPHCNPACPSPGALVYLSRMHQRILLSIGLLAVPSIALTSLAACGGDDSTGGGGATASSTTSTTSGTGGEGDSGSGGDGQGGNGGDEQGGNGGDEQGGNGGEISGEPAGHLLISEVAVSPGAAEFVEIWNPTEADVDLTNYYLSDNSAYFRITQGAAWAPAGSEGTDFLVRFPAGTTIPAGGYLVLASHDSFESEYARCADFALDESPISCGGDTIPAMEAPENGALGASSGALLTDDGEMLVLFEWDGTEGNPLKDVDYVIWGEATGASSRAYKTGTRGYASDTERAAQRSSTPPGRRQSIVRCSDVEFGELLTDGNGISGHDETSERLDKSFIVTTTPSPGEPNDCPSE